MGKENGKRLYEILNVKEDCSVAEITKAYRTLALKIHPDKNPNDNEAHDKFSQLQKAYEILKDPVKRKQYDISGVEDPSLNDQELYKYFQKLWKKVTSEDIDAYEKSYKGSSEEEEDLCQFIIKYQGDVKHLLEVILFSEFEDLPRYDEIIRRCFESGKLDKGYFGVFEKSFGVLSKKQKLYEKKKKNEEKLFEKSVGKKKNDTEDLFALIQQKNLERQGNADSYFDHLAAKYAPKKKKVKQ